MIDLVTVIISAGYLGLIAVVFAESGLFFGFFLPGDSLLFTAGLLASQQLFDIRILIPLLAIAAILGDNVGYAFGKKVGPKLFAREESRFFKPAHVIRAQNFFARHGKKAIILARFLPILRTFVPIVAGVANMPYKEFLRWNIIGGIAWTAGITLFGYYLGKLIPNAEHYLYPMVIGIIVLSFVPVIREWYKSRT